MEPAAPSALALEWADYARTAWFASVVPGMEVTVTSDAVFLSNSIVPTPDGNHAALLRAAPEDTDALIERVCSHYSARGVSPCVAVSPACTPTDLTQRLAAHGFCEHGEPEYWLVLENPKHLLRYKAPANITIRQADDSAGISDFCGVMEAAYDMPEGTSFVLNHFFGHINALPGIRNYVATLDGQPVGCASLFTYLGVSAFGSGGVLPGLRYSGAILGLIERIYEDWRQDGAPVMVTQTVLPKLERTLQHFGFRTLFTRRYYLRE